MELEFAIRKEKENLVTQCLAEAAKTCGCDYNYRKSDDDMGNFYYYSVYYEEPQFAFYFGRALGFEEGIKNK